jgi:uncharacterized protein (DUF1697 family)
MPTCISLLRGINVGGNKRVPMADLKRLYESLGFSQVQTLLQSGNAVFQSDQTDTAALTHLIEAGIQRTFGFESRIILRTPDQWRTLMTEHPFSSEQMADPAKILVFLLAAPPHSEGIPIVTAGVQPPEIVHLRGQEVYLYFGDGMGRSKLSTAWIEKQLRAVGTGRNWNTVVKLMALADGGV